MPSALCWQHKGIRLVGTDSRVLDFTIPLLFWYACIYVDVVCATRVDWGWNNKRRWWRFSKLDDLKWRYDAVVRQRNKAVFAYVHCIVVWARYVTSHPSLFQSSRPDGRAGLSSAAAWATRRKLMRDPSDAQRLRGALPIVDLASGSISRQWTDGAAGTGGGEVECVALAMVTKQSFQSRPQNTCRPPWPRPLVHRCALPLLERRTGRHCRPVTFGIVYVCCRCGRLSVLWPLHSTVLGVS